MTSKVAKHRAPAKSARVPEGNQIAPEGNQISPVMQKARGLLGPVKAAEMLQFLTGRPESLCRKNLSGDRIENRDMLAAMAQSKLIIAVVLGLSEGSTDPVVKAVRKEVRKIELKLQLEAIDGE